MSHISVLLHEAIVGLEINDGDIIVDATLGGGGHTEAILASGKNIKVIAIDADQTAIERSRKRLGKDDRVTFIRDNFRNLPRILEKVEVPKVNKILFDFGFSSDQIDPPNGEAGGGRGFSFQRDEPLLMTFSADPKPEELTAYEVVNRWEEDTLRTVIRGFGEERFAGRIAKAIVSAREKKPIESTFELAEIVRAATPAAYGRKRIHPATRTFQAIRIAVNDELTSITQGLEGSFRALSSKGRIIAISFHSLEDRIVKRTFRAWADTDGGKIITKKPLVAGENEKSTNPRSRSAKLRIFEKN
jgi:16S rRNA (cytosine1402-N4)-methyltransferase